MRAFNESSISRSDKSIFAFSKSRRIPSALRPHFSFAISRSTQRKSRLLKEHKSVFYFCVPETGWNFSPRAVWFHFASTNRGVAFELLFLFDEQREISMPEFLHHVILRGKKFSRLKRICVWDSLGNLLSSCFTLSHCIKKRLSFCLCLHTILCKLCAADA